MRALWIEDHVLVADSLELWLQVKKPELELSIDKAPDLSRAIDLLDTIQYELVLLDWWLGTQDGQATIPALRRAGCRAPIVVVSADDRGKVMSRALALGAVGYVPKTASPEYFFHTIDQALKGRITQPRKELQDKTKTLGALPEMDLAIQFPNLTSREIDVFRLVKEGLSNKKIALELGIMESTVKTHVRKILEGVGVHGRSQAAAIAHSGRR